MIAGIIFLLPILVLVVLANKVLLFFTSLTSRFAAMFGLKSFLGVSGGTIAGAIGLLLFIFFCGYLVRVAFFKQITNWVDNKLSAHIPGYSIYREMAMSKLVEKEEVLPYQMAALFQTEGKLVPCFVMESGNNGEVVAFFPSAGNTKEGSIQLVPGSMLRKLPETDMRKFRQAIDKNGIGLVEAIK